MNEALGITGFEEKPSHLHPCVPASTPRFFCASAGVYLFSTQVLLDGLRSNSQNPASTLDFGRDVIPMLVGN